VREDLKPGAQAVQGMHAAICFSRVYKERCGEWYRNSEHIAFLAVKDEKELDALLQQAVEMHILAVEFREPDFDNQLTAICLEPGDKTKKLCSHLKLALRT
jgi:peptidyl-tRNA hydrolase